MDKHLHLTRFVQLFNAFANEERLAFAKKCGTSIAYLRHIMYGHRKAGGFTLTIASVTNWQLTPHYLWPEKYPNPYDGLPPAIAQALIESAASLAIPPVNELAP